MTTHLNRIPANFALVAAAMLFVAYSVICTVSGGELMTVSSPMLVAAIALFVWHDRQDG